MSSPQLERIDWGVFTVDMLKELTHKAFDEIGSPEDKIELLKELEDKLDE